LRLLLGVFGVGGETVELVYTAVSWITGLTGLVCFIMALIKMFQTGNTVLGIVCIVLTPCCGIGWLIGFIFGWVKATEWNFKNVMIIWTVAFVVNIIVGVANPEPYRKFQEQMKQMQAK